MRLPHGLLAAPLLCALLALPGVSTAQQVKIGVFDPNKILNGSKLGQKLQDELNQFRVQREAEIKRQADDLKRLTDQYKASAGNMSPEMREQTENDLRQRDRDLQRVLKDAETDLQLRRQKAVRRLEEEVAAVIDDFGKRNGYTLILQRDLCAFSLDSLDVSDELVRLVDARTAGR